jgi:hypothetical protein
MGELGLLDFFLSLGECRFEDSSFETDFNFAGEGDKHLDIGEQLVCGQVPKSFSLTCLPSLLSLNRLISFSTSK